MRCGKVLFRPALAKYLFLICLVHKIRFRKEVKIRWMLLPYNPTLLGLYLLITCPITTFSTLPTSYATLPPPSLSLAGVHGKAPSLPLALQQQVSSLRGGKQEAGLNILCSDPGVLFLWLWSRCYYKSLSWTFNQRQNTYINNEEIQPAPGICEIHLEAIGHPLQQHFQNKDVCEDLVSIF